MKDYSHANQILKSHALESPTTLSTEVDQCKFHFHIIFDLQSYDVEQVLSEWEHSTALMNMAWPGLQKTMLLVRCA